MDIKPVARAAVSDAVFEQLVDEIVSGRLAPEEAIPGERELAERFGVNRHAVREALKRVRQAGLVRIAHGGKTRVLDWRSNAGLDVLFALVTTGALPPARVLCDIVEMRRSVASDAARLCASRASDEQIAAISAAAQDYPSSASDLDTVAQADLTFWTAVIDGSNNVAYRLALNTLVAGIVEIGFGTVAELGLGAEYADRDAHVRLAQLIGERDADAAYSHANDLLGKFVERLASTVQE